MIFIGDYDIRPHLGNGAEAFRKAMVPVFREMKPDKSKISAGLAMGNLWAACEGIVEGDIIRRQGLTERTSTVSSPAATSTTQGMNCRTGGAWTGNVRSAETT